MNFKVWSILAVVALVFVLTATANPEEEHVAKVNHHEEAKDGVKKHAEKPAKKHSEKHAAEKHAGKHAEKSEHHHDVAGAEHAKQMKKEDWQKRFNQKKAEHVKEAKKRMEAHANKMKAEKEHHHHEEKPAAPAPAPAPVVPAV